MKAACLGVVLALRYHSQQNEDKNGQSQVFSICEEEEEVIRGTMAGFRLSVAASQFLCKEVLL